MAEAISLWMRGAAVAVSVAVLAGCSVRLETPEPSWPSPSADTVLRDELAAAMSSIESQAQTHGDTLAQQIAQEHLELLGGVYVAYPSANAAPSASPTTASASAASPTTTADAVAAAVETASTVASETQDENLRRLATSIELAWSLFLWSAGSPRDPDPALVEGITPWEAVRTLEAPTTPEPWCELALAHDEARFAYEVIAAHSTDVARDEALARAAAHGEIAAAYTVPCGSDVLTPMYQLSGVDLATPEGLATLSRAVETTTALLASALAVQASGTERGCLLAQAYTSWIAAMAHGEPLPHVPGISATE